MVVQFALDVTTPSSDERSAAVKKKYLVSRTRDHKTSIFDYVHLSSSLLRKVRYGQSLDAALQTRSPWTSTDASSSSPIGFRASRASVHSSPSPLSIWRELDSPGASPSRRFMNQRSENVHTHAHDGAIRYGRTIQLQATDGGFLAVDIHGCLTKLPPSHREDPSTVLTLFPHDPLLAPRRKSHVCNAGELCFLVVGAATIRTDHNVVYADAKKTLEPPPWLRHAVICHQRQHEKSPQNRTSSREKKREKPSSTVWSLRRMPLGTRADALETGMVVQLTQRDWTVHYETERIVKKKYTPITTTTTMTTTTTGPEADDSTIQGTDDSAAESSRSGVFSQVWLQQNDLSSQHHDPTLNTAKPLHHWDNLWFLVDIASDRDAERRRKQQDAVRAAEREATLRNAENSEDREHERPQCVEPCASSRQGNNNNDGDDDTSRRLAKRVSVVHARVFVSHAAEQAQRHAAAIIVRFLRRALRRDAERRAKELIDRRIIRRTNKPSHELERLTTHQQLRILQCFKPNIFGSQRAMAASDASRIPGISLQGIKHPQQEAQRLAAMERDLEYLGSSEFQHVVARRSRDSSSSASVSSCASPLPPPRRHHLHNTTHQQLSREKRDRDQKIHVQLAMAHREKPPFRFGKPTHLPVRLQQLRPQTAPASPTVKP